MLDDLEVGTPIYDGSLSPRWTNWGGEGESETLTIGVLSRLLIFSKCHAHIEIKNPELVQ